MADKDDRWHKPSASFVESHRGRLIVPSPVIPEICYLLNAYLGQASEMAFLTSLANRELSIEHFNAGDLHRSMELMNQYKDANIGFVDASVAAIAERLKITELLTTDRRHFSIIRPGHCKGFVLLP